MTGGGKFCVTIGGIECCISYTHTFVSLCIADIARTIVHSELVNCWISVSFTQDKACIVCEVSSISCGYSCPKNGTLVLSNTAGGHWVVISSRQTHPACPKCMYIWKYECSQALSLACTVCGVHKQLICSIVPWPEPVVVLIEVVMEGLPGTRLWFLYMHIHTYICMYVHTSTNVRCVRECKMHP